MTEPIKIHKAKPETRLAPEERAARDHRAATATVANLPGTRQPFERRASAPTVRHHTPLQTKNS